jgi:hypothetical protein
MATNITQGEQRAVEQGLMTIDEDGRRRCVHDRPVYDYCHECMAALSSGQLRLMGKARAAATKEGRGG